jgi:sugar phosphate isomerase/epimerase
MISFLTQDKDFFPSSFKEKFSFLKQMGFEGFEIDGKQLLENFEMVRQATKEINFPVVTACGGYRGWIGDFDEPKRKQAIKDICEILKRLSGIGGKGIVIPAAWGMFSLRLPPMTPPRSASEDEVVIMGSLNQLNDCAKENNVQIFLEPLNRYEDHMINTLEKARYYIDKGKFSNVSIIADFYHMNIEEAKINESILQQKNYIGHIHLADSHRYQPGSGHIDFKEGFQALKKINYDGAMTFECRVTGQNAEENYRKSLQYIKKLASDAWKN